MKKLKAIGFDHWFEAHVAENLQEDQDIARVSAVDRGSFRVRNEDREISAELAGEFSFRAESSVDLPSIGDWVTVQYHDHDTAAIIQGVFPRKTFLRRRRPGQTTDFQMIAANIDTAFIIQSCHLDFNLRRMDRYLVMAAEGGVAPIIVLTKTDLISAAELEQRLQAIRQSGITARVLALSNLTGIGFDEFRQVLTPGQTYCLLGSSGVGKTTLINRLVGHDTYKTREVSGTGEGTHTAARRQLIVLNQGALLIDTPGMRELGLLGAGDGVTLGFEDIFALSRDCRYADCSHTQEPGCAVLAALTGGELREERYFSYHKIRKESEYYEMSYVDKRKKDKAFGRYIKSVQKRIKE